MKIEDAQPEVYTKIGWNVVLFQKLEILLKFIVSRLEISGGADDVKNRYSKQTEEIFRKTLGQLVGEH